jgi:nitroreductase
MNETLRVIYNRRSVRAYKSEQIKDSELQAILDAGILAPSANNVQKWHLTVIQNKGILDRMSKSIAEIMKNSGNPVMAERAGNPDYHTFYNAPTVVIISGEEKFPYTQNDCSASAENILIAAESLNIGSCWIASSNHLFKSDKGEQFKKELGIPETYIPVVSISLGYKTSEDTSVPPKNREVINYVK